MSNLKSKALIAILVLGFFSAANVYATTLSLSADSNPSATVGQYQFSNSLISGSSFSDILNFTAASSSVLAASVSGTSDSSIIFSVFNLYSGSNGTGTFLKSGTIYPSGLATISFAGLAANSLSGSYYLEISGTQSGNSSYNGNLTLTTPVPEPSTPSMVLTGLALVGLVARRKM